MIKKPGILNNDTRVLELEDKLLGCKVECDVMELVNGVLELQNDYCYKEILGQFRGLINKFLHRSPDDSHYCLGCILLEAGTSSAYDHCRLFGNKVDYDRNGIKKCDKCLNFWQALQGLEEG